MASTVASQALHLKIGMQLRYFLTRTSYFLLLTSLLACSSSKNITSQPQPDILSDSNLLNAHVGISIYDPSINKYLYSHQADKYFIPASNTKLFTCYAAMKHLGDSLVGLRYLITDFSKFYDSVGSTKDRYLLIQANADPSFLHPDFKNHPVYNFLNRTHNLIYWLEPNWQTKRWANGWAWNDYMEPYMAERSAFPMYGNVIQGSVIPVSKRTKNEKDLSGKLLEIYPHYFDSATNRNITYLMHYFDDSVIQGKLNRRMESDYFFIDTDTDNYLPQKFTLPFYAEGISPSTLLADTLTTTNEFSYHPIFFNGKTWQGHNRSFSIDPNKETFKIIYSHPTDSLLKPMMHRSDNFFAEQTLLMVSNEMTGVMNDAKIIDSFLKTDLKDLPQKPRWVDGSGLSRYNLFSPNDMVHVLNKMKNEFDWNRITTILPTGGEGTLSNYYINLKDRIFAKTGTLSNNIALSGFLITKQNKTLIFSVLVNNHMGNTTQIRRAVEKYLTEVAEKH
jgi:serine-type D-Ala-D-Ala carboxypeptidase/endopeptidase (penicillin-binding protein 4)